LLCRETQNKVAPLEDERPFRDFRRRSVLAAFSVAALSAAALALIYRYQPLPPGSKEKGWRLGEATFDVLQSTLTVLLGIGLVTLIYEIIVRESYARDLRKFLRLRTALVTSGLEELRTDQGYEWREVLITAGTITALIRDPSIWIVANFPIAIEAAQKRATTITIGLPDAQGPSFADIARSVGLSEDQLAQNIDVARDLMENQWTTHESRISRGSRLRVVAYTAFPLYEVVLADDQVVCLFPRTVGHELGDERLALAFVQERSEFPASWLRRPLDVLQEANELYASDV
jgi:hypothetical protein